MLYLKNKDIHLVILETDNLEEIKKGRPVHSADGEVFICWTPDPAWLTQRIIESKGDLKKIFEAIDEASKRPQKEVGPYHDSVQIDLRGG